MRCGLQLSRRRLDNWPAFLIGKIKAAGISHIASPKSFAELCGQALGQQDKQFFAISGSCLALLFVFNNVPANLEVGTHLNQFESARKMIADFLRDVERMKNEHHP